jgi:hypothetical protein
VIPFFGSSFTSVFPLFIGVIFIFTLLNLCTKLLSFLNIQTFQYAAGGQSNASDDETADTISEGITLINTEKRKREREMNSIETNVSRNNSTRLSDMNMTTSLV